MTSANAPIDSHLSTFFAAWPFIALPATVRGQVAAKLRLCSFQTGESIHRPRELPSAVHCVVQGRVRVFGSSSDQSQTLAVLGKGAVVGWDNLLRRVRSGAVQAALHTADSDVATLTLALPADDFEAIMLRHLMPVLQEQASLIELFDVLSRFLSDANALPSQVAMKELVQHIHEERLARVQHWSAGGNPFKIGQDNNRLPQLSPDYLWLISGGDCRRLTIGTLLHSPLQLRRLRPTRFPIRLLGIDRLLLTSLLPSSDHPALIIPPVQTFHEPSLPIHAVPEPVEGADSSLPSAVSIAHDPEAALRHGDLSDADSSPGRKRYPIWRSPIPEVAEDVVACFGMVCDRMEVPYRPDTLRRWLRKQPLEGFEPIDLYTRIGQAIGFNAQVVQFTATTGGLNRLQTPALIQCRDVLTVLHDISPEVAVLGSPRTGLLRIAPRRLVKQLVPDKTTSEAGQVMCRAIALERFERSPSKRFGFHWFVPVLVTQWGILAQVLLASMLIQILTVANPLLVQQIIDNVIINANAGAMTMFGVLMVLFALLEGGLTILRRYLLASTTNRIDLHLGIEIVRHLLRLPLPFFERYAVGELSVRLSELENIRQFLTDSAITVVLDVLFSAIYIAVMLLYSVPLTICVLITVPVVVVSTLLMSNVQEKLIRVRADHSAKVQSYLVEVLSGISAVKAQHIESLVEATWRERYVQYLSTGFVANTIGTAFFSYSNFLNTASSLLVLWVGANQVLQGQMTLGGLIAFRILTGYVTGPLLRLASLWQRFQETALSMNLLADIADAPMEELDDGKPRVELLPIQGRVQYQGVSFGFQPGQLQLENIDLEIAPNTFVGIVGQSGSGKSTLMKLLPRLYSPQSGSILIDGQDVSRVSLSSLRSQIGIVSQDAVLFQGTIRDNISLFSDLPEETVIEAAKVAEAHEFILQLPNGYDTPVAEKGGTLSGGQRQRISIARVVARDPRLLIFDEATSALDYETERRVCQNLMQKFRDRTCFFITHRLNTVVGADWVLFMQNGIIAEQGTHTDLMARRQLYYCLCSQQFQNP